MRELAQKFLNFGDLLEKVGMVGFFRDILIMWTSTNV
jgi:hypothetical protein